MLQTSDTAKKPLGLHYGFVIVACCCLMMGINVGLTFSCAGIFYVPVSESLGISVGKFGIYMSIMYITSSLMLSVAGEMLERWSARLLFSSNASVMGLTFIGMSCANSVWQFYVAGGILGVTLAFLLYLSFPTLVNRWFHTNVGLMIGICSAASGIGGMIFNPIAGKIISDYGWRWGYASFGIIILVVVVPLLALLLRNYPSDMGLLPFGFDKEIETENTKKSIAYNSTDDMCFKVAVRNPIFYALIIFAFIMMGTSTLNLFIPGFVTGRGFSLEQAATVAAIVMGGVTIGKLVLGWINDRNCFLGLLMTTMLGAAGLGALIIENQNIYFIFVGAFLFGWQYAGVTVQTAMLTRKIFGNKDYSRIYAIISIALAVGGAVASGGWGLISDATSLSTIFKIGIATLIIAFILGCWGLFSKK